jgi:hypothetical protein
MKDLAKANLEQLRSSIREVLALVRQAAQEIHAEAGPAYQRSPPVLRLISPLAEGSDRLVAEVAREDSLGFELQCPLPFSRAEYEKDFQAWESKAKFRKLLESSATTAVLELDGDPAQRPEAYEAVGRVVLRQCDILIAIWDGAHAKGTGGTAQVIGEALSVEIPTIWVRSEAPHEALLLQSVEAQTTAPLDRLRSFMRGLFLPPTEKGFGDAHRYFAERPPRWMPGCLFKLFRNVWSGKWKSLGLKAPNFLQPQSRKWSKCWAALFRVSPSLRATLEADFLPSFDWADNLAEYYGGLYRSSLVANFMMGAFAVLVAFLGLALHVHFWFILEFFIILTIIAVTYRGRKQFWHHRWMDYRLLAESLRQMQFLAPLGRVSSAIKIPAHLEPSDPRQSWFNWHFRALVREVGMLSAVLDAEYLKNYREVLEEAIRGQVKYHQDNHFVFHRIHHRLHLMAQRLFAAAAAACFLHVLPGSWFERVLGHHKGQFEFVLVFCAIVLPAFGGSISAISHEGEFYKLELRSKALGDRLDKLSSDLAGASTTSRELGRIARAFSDLALAELVDWRFVFLGKELALPA